MNHPTDIRRRVHPPGLACWVLRRTIPARHRQFALGDLEEEFRDLVNTPAGLRGARLWYWRQAWRCLLHPEAPARLLEETPRTQGATLLDAIRQDLRYGMRSLMKAPGFLLAAAGTLALGIGATAAIFSVVHAVLLRPLPFRDPEQLVALWETDRANGNERWRVAPANFRDWSATATVFTDTAAFGANAVTLTGGGEPVQLKGSRVTDNYFSLLGVSPRLGRSFVPEDAAAATPLVILGHALWQSRFGGSEHVLGMNLTLDGTPYVVIGVMPAGIYPSWPVNGPRMHFERQYQDFWTLLPPTALVSRRSHVLGVIARMKPGIGLQQAQQQMDGVARRLEQAYAENRDEGAAVRPLMDEVAGSVRPVLWILLAAVSAVLLAACSNVAGLVLARFTMRRREIAVRCALGAGRGAILRQFFVEGLLLAGLAGAAGLWVAVQATRLLFGLVPEEIPRLAEAGLDGRVLLFTASVSLVAAFFFALAPVWSARRVRLSATLKESARAGESSRSLRLRNLLVVAQVGLAVILAVAAGLLAQSFARMQRVQPGFRGDNLLILEMMLPPTQYASWQRIAGFYRRLLDSARRVPGVDSAQIAYDHPLESNWLTGFAIEGRPQEKADSVQLRIVSPGYFAGLGHALLEGRDFDEREDAHQPGVAVINRSFARRYFQGSGALGRIILCTAASSNWNGQMPDRFEIVGVVNDVQPLGLDARVQPFLYLSSWQFPRWEMKLLVRTQQDPLASVAALRRVLRELDPALPIANLTTMDRIFAQAVARPRLSTVLVGAFGALGMLLALVGVYGVVAFWVGARTREIGVRVALGARRRDVLVFVLQRGARLILPGIGAGIVGAMLLARFLQSQLYGISAADPVTLVGVPAAIACAGLLACLLPARRAARVDPVIALRCE